MVATSPAIGGADVATSIAPSPQDDAIPDDMGVNVVRGEGRWLRPGRLIGWALWERHGSQVLVRRIVYLEELQREGHRT